MNILHKSAYMLDFLQSLPEVYAWILQDGEGVPFQQVIIQAIGDRELFIRNQLEASDDPQFFYAFARCTSDPAISRAFQDCAVAVGHSILLNHDPPFDIVLVFLRNRRFEAVEELVLAHRIIHSLVHGLPSLH